MQGLLGMMSSAVQPKSVVGPGDPGIIKSWLCSTNKNIRVKYSIEAVN